jgi:hypothetical protein
MKSTGDDLRSFLGKTRAEIGFIRPIIEAGRVP